MLKRVVIVNHLGESMEYAIEGFQADNNPSGLLITSIEGLGPGKATVNTTKIPTSDGDIVNSVRLSGKNVVIKFKFTGVTSVEDARLLSYRIFPIKKKVTFYIETDNREATIDGYVESNEPVVFSPDCEMQVSILCESAYFDGGANEYEIVDQGVIVFDGDTNNGIVMDFEVAEGGDISSIQISNENEETMDLNASKMSGIVPNTSPNELNISNCSFRASMDSTFKYLGELPRSVDSESDDSAYQELYSSGYGYQSYLVFCNGVLHYFCLVNNDGAYACEHFIKNDETHTWDRLQDVSREIPYQGNEHFVIFELNGVIYGLFDVGDYPICRLDTSNNAWVTVISSTIQVPTTEYNYTWAVQVSCAYNGVEHLFVTEYRGHPSGDIEIYDKFSFHFSFDGENFTVIGDYSESGIFYGYSFANCFGAMVHDNKLQLFSTTYGDLYEQNKCGLYEWNGSTWTSSQISKPGISSSRPTQIHWLSSPVEINGVIHMFIFLKNVSMISTNVYIEHHTYDAANDEWTQISSEIGFAYAGRTVTDGTYVYFAGSPVIKIEDYFQETIANTYTEPPNNVRFVSNDGLIVSTIKGHKSITLYRGRSAYNVINILGRYPTWFQLHRGSNTIGYTAEGDSVEGKLSLTVAASRLYEGV